MRMEEGGEGQGGGRMMSIEWVGYGAEGVPRFGGFISAAATTTTTFWMDGDSVVMILFSPLPSRCLPAGVQRRDGVLDVRERARARVWKCMDRLCIFFSSFISIPLVWARVGRWEEGQMEGSAGGGGGSGMIGSGWLLWCGWVLLCCC